MKEPGRIGLTAEATAQLDEMLEEINPEEGEEGNRLIKFDLYRLAVAMGVKNKVKAPVLSDKSLTSFRVTEFDAEGVFYAVVESSSLLPKDTPVYEYIERLAEYEIRQLYTTFRDTGQFPFEEYFSA